MAGASLSAKNFAAKRVSVVCITQAEVIDLNSLTS